MGWETEWETDAHGFEVPRQYVSKYRSFAREIDTGATTAGAAIWATTLLSQAREKQYRAGGPLPPRFVAAVKAGIPAEHRREVWLLLSGAAARLAARPGDYASYLVAGRAEAAVEVEAQIDRDLRRTPPHRALTEEFNAQVKAVLVAFSHRSRDVAYCQGMNFVTAALLLVTGDEASAFHLLCYVVDEVLPGHYTASMAGHQADQLVLARLLAAELPSVSRHLHRLGLSPQFVTTQVHLARSEHRVCMATPRLHA